jgi:hypothetical protein
MNAYFIVSRIGGEVVQGIFEFHVTEHGPPGIGGGHGDLGVNHGGFEGGSKGGKTGVGAFILPPIPDRFGPRRVDGARKLRGIAIGDVFCLRPLRVEVRVEKTFAGCL